MMIERPVDQLVSGPKGMAGRHVLSGVLLWIGGSISARRTVWTDIAGQARRRFNPGEYRGRARTGKYRKFRAVPSRVAGLAERTRNAPFVGGAGGNPQRQRSGSCHGAMRELGQNASRADSILAGQVHNMTIRYSP